MTETPYLLVAIIATATAGILGITLGICALRKTR